MLANDVLQESVSANYSSVLSVALPRGSRDTGQAQYQARSSTSRAALLMLSRFVTDARTGCRMVTAQVGWMAQARRRDLAKFDGWWVRASMMFQPCFLAVEKKERMRAKSIAPSDERKPPEIF